MNLMHTGTENQSQPSVMYILESVVMYMIIRLYNITRSAAPFFLHTEVPASHEDTTV